MKCDECGIEISSWHTFGDQDLCFDCYARIGAESVSEAEQCSNKPPRRYGQPCPLAVALKEACDFADSCGHKGHVEANKWRRLLPDKDGG